MTKKTRRLFFWLAVVVFLLVTPVIIGYARGYRFDFERLEIIQVGAIYLDSEPDDSKIFIDGRETNKETPAILSGLFPFDTYTVRLEKNGYLSWEKDLLVETRGITRAEAIILPPEKWETEDYFSTSTPLLQFSISPNGRNALYWNGSPGILNVNRQELSAIIFPDRLSTSLIKDPVWLENGSRAIFKRIVSDNTTQWHVLDVSSRTTQNIGVILPQNIEPTQINFSPCGGALVLSDNELYSVGLDFENISDPFFSKIETFEVGEGRIFALTSSSTVNEISDTGEVIKDYGTLEFVPNHLSLSPDGRKLAYFNNENLGILWVREAEEAPFVKAGYQEIIMEDAKITGQFYWHKKSHHFFVLLEPNNLVFVELDGRGERNMWRWNDLKLLDFSYLPRIEQLWLLDENGSLLRHPDRF